MKQSKIRLSQCMIVKNEEKHIEKALSWGKEIVYEQIVVDTGSTDRTVEIAKAMGAKVFHFTWNDNFSAAKNYALKQAKGNWIAFLDADEYFPEEDAEKLIRILQDVNQDPSVNIIRSKMLHINESDGSILMMTTHHRIFRNDPKLRYRNRIHEELYYKGQKGLQALDVQEELMIVHTGYSQGKNMEEKGMRNAELLEEEVREDPTNALKLKYLGDAYHAMHRTEEALECYRKILWDPEMKSEDKENFAIAGIGILALRAGEPPEETEEEYRQVEQKMIEMGLDGHPDLDYFFGEWYGQKKENVQMAARFERALQKLEQYRGGRRTSVTAEACRLNWIIATTAYNEKQDHKAVQFAVAALRIDKYSPEAIQILLLAFRREWREGTSAKPYWDFLCKIYDRNNLKDLLFLRKFTQEIQFAALEQQVWLAIPEEAKQYL